MPLGWIDFSKSERGKVLSVLELLGERDTLDELGIAPVRDGFANLFFPGTSTIQTRAKYFLIVPYALKELELEKKCDPNQLWDSLNDLERECAQQLRADKLDTDGIIGKLALEHGSWVKRTPADIYWSGLRRYGIFMGGNLSLSEYVRAICDQKKGKKEKNGLGNRRIDAQEQEVDDKDAGADHDLRFWNLSTYEKHWRETLSIRLTPEEGTFLRTRIISSCPDSMLGYVLRERNWEFLDCKSFQELESVITSFPELVQRDYALARDFSEFLLVVRTVYNLVVSADQNLEALALWSEQKVSLSQLSNVDLQAIFQRLNLYRHLPLREFLSKMQSLMMDGDLEAMKREVTRRETALKQSRAKTQHPGEMDVSAWYGGKQLNYRFANAKRIVRDLMESEVQDAQTQ